MKKFILPFTIVFAYIAASCSLDDSISFSDISEEERLALEEELIVDDPYYWTTQIVDRALPTDAMMGNSGSSGSNRAGELDPSHDYFDIPLPFIYPSGGDYVYSIFEDNFPSKGDYDFNDLIIRSKYMLTERVIANDVVYNTWFDDGWKGAIMTYLVNDGAAYDHELGFIFYHVTSDESGGDDYFQRIPNDQIKIGISSSLVSLEGSEPWSEDASLIFNTSMNGIKSYDPTENVCTVSFEISGLGDMNDRAQGIKIWISAFIKVKDTGETILPSGFPKYITDEEEESGVFQKFKLGSADYLVDVDGEKMPSALEFIADEFTPVTEGVPINAEYNNFYIDTNWFSSKN